MILTPQYLFLVSFTGHPQGMVMAVTQNGIQAAYESYARVAQEVAREAGK